MAHVMVDLETWGTRPGSALRSIGAVVFDPANPTAPLGEAFYAVIDDASCAAIGLVKDPRTVQWWAEQSTEAKAAFEIDPRPIGGVLREFSAWFTKVGGEQVWGHGASFDPVLLEAAYDAVLLEAPWKFWDVRCCRTVLAMANRRPERHAKDVHHNALDDAKAQARAVQAAFRYGSFRAA